MERPTSSLADAEALATRPNVRLRANATPRIFANFCCKVEVMLDMPFRLDARFRERDLMLEIPQRRLELDIFAGDADISIVHRHYYVGFDALFVDVAPVGCHIPLGRDLDGAAAGQVIYSLNDALAKRFLA